MAMTDRKTDFRCTAGAVVIAAAGRVSIPWTIRPAATMTGHRARIPATNKAKRQCQNRPAGHLPGRFVSIPL